MDKRNFFIIKTADKEFCKCRCENIPEKDRCSSITRKTTTICIVEDRIGCYDFSYIKRIVKKASLSDIVLLTSRTKNEKIREYLKNYIKKEE